jgi:predicted nucleic acid-binding protein
VTAFFDTNVFVYAIDGAEPKKARRAGELIEEHVLGGSLVLSTQVLSEFFSVATTRLRTRLDSDQAMRHLRELATLPTVVIDAAIILAAASRARSDKLSFWDSLIVEAALAAGASTLYSEDMQHDRRIAGLRIVNPFRERA